MLDRPDIFVSYASLDRERVRQLVETLRTFGWTVWWDRELRPGETWDEVIGGALAAARCVVVVWSNQAVLSDWVKIEAEHARQRDALVPVYFDMVPTPAPLDKVHGADLTDWSGEAWHHGLQQAVSAIREKLVPVMSPSAAESRDDRSAEPFSSHAPASFEPPLLKEKMLDAAISRELTVGRASDLIVMVRRADSGGLRAILDLDDEYSASSADVRTSPPFDIEFPRDEAGRLGRITLTLKVHSGDVDVVPPLKHIVIAPERDSAVYAFIVTARRAGVALINLDLLQDAVCLVSRILRPGVVDVMEARESAPMHLVSMTLPVRASPRLPPGRLSHDADTRAHATGYLSEDDNSLFAKLIPESDREVYSPGGRVARGVVVFRAIRPRVRTLLDERVRQQLAATSDRVEQVMILAALIESSHITDVAVLPLAVLIVRMGVDEVLRH